MTDDDTQKLEAAIQRLEKIVEELNRGGLDIETGLKKFKEGAALIRFCRGELEKAENEFKKIKEKLEFETENDAAEN